MNEKHERCLNWVECVLGRIGLWFLWSWSLARFICNREIAQPMTLAILGVTPEQFKAKAESLGAQVWPQNEWGLFLVGVHGEGFFVQILHGDYGDLLIAPPSDINAIRGGSDLTMTAQGIWRYRIDHRYPFHFQLPYQYGTCLDRFLEQFWFKMIDHRIPEQYRRNAFFDDARRKNGIELLEEMLECGARAGIRDYMFPGFGTMLGIVMCGDFIPEDRDMDMCILSDDIEPEQERAYLNELEKAKLFEFRRRGPEARADNGRFLWFSLGPKSVHDGGVKSCNWFFFEHEGIMWHSKGGQWINGAKFNGHKFHYAASDAAICKGIPAGLLRDMRPVDFHGVSTLVPAQAGACCDHWYTGWDYEKGGASKKNLVMVVGNWKDKRTWRMV